LGLLGAHVSIAGGIEKAITRGEALGCESIQIFSKNQQQWHTAPIPQTSVDAFLERLQKSPIQSVVVHNAYLINMAHPNAEEQKRSREAFLDEITRADQLNAAYLVFHPGSHLQTDINQGIQRIADSLNWALDQKPSSVKLLLETTSGQGSHIGSLFEELAEVIALVHQKDHMGICFDTAHSFAAGYEMNDEKYHATFNLLDDIIGFEYLKVFHLNDSKKELGSKVDRHENIGKGKLGAEPFRLLVNDSRFSKHPMILETPGGDACFKRNLKLLRSFVKRRQHGSTIFSGRGSIRIGEGKGSC